MYISYLSAVFGLMWRIARSESNKQSCNQLQKTPAVITVDR